MAPDHHFQQALACTNHFETVRSNGGMNQNSCTYLIVFRSHFYFSWTLEKTPCSTVINWHSKAITGSSQTFEYWHTWALMINLQARSVVAKVVAIAPMPMVVWPFFQLPMDFWGVVSINANDKAKHVAVLLRHVFGEILHYWKYPKIQYTFRLVCFVFLYVKARTRRRKKSTEKEHAMWWEKMREKWIRGDTYRWLLLRVLQESGSPEALIMDLIGGLF